MSQDTCPKMQRIFDQTEELTDKIMEFLAAHDGPSFIVIAALTTCASVIAQGLEHEIGGEGDIIAGLRGADSEGLPEGFTEDA